MEQQTQHLQVDRMKALKQVFLSDAKTEEAFDRLTNMVARILGAPISFLSLVDVERHYIKSAVGTHIKELPLSHSFCKHVVATGQPLIVNDARQHPLVKDNPAIVEYDVIGYLGVPLHTADGMQIGSLCVVDNKPRQWSDEEIAIIEEIAHSVMMEIELRVQLYMRQNAARDLSTTEVYGHIPKSSDYVGVYRIIQKIGSGGMADVYIARHHVLNNLVAIKQLRLNQDHETFDRFELEAQIISQLKHPNIIRLFDYGRHNGTPYIVLEYVNGVDLKTFLKRNDKLDFYQDGAILLDIAEALDYAHAKGIVHRDVKPDNVLLRRRYRDGKPLDQFHAILTDFGIAKQSDSHDNLTDENLVGTMNYIAPEQITQSDALNHRVDIYSLGIMAYQFLTGHLPFKAENVGQLLQMHMMKPMPDPRQYAPDLSESQVDALRKALAKDPNDRPQTAREFVVMLQ